MKKLLPISLYAVALVLLATGVQAQTFFSVTHMSGTQTIGGIPVTVIPVNSPQGPATNCTGPYYIGGPSTAPDGNIYAFATPVSQVQINNSIMHNNEILGFYINGSHYPITSSNIAASPYNCSNNTGVAYANTNGDLAVSGTGHANMQINLNPGFPIDSIRVQHLTGLGAGCLYNFFFAIDTAVFISQPFNDTMMCAGDTVQIPYYVSKKFKTNNTFTAQLSDASGSFSSPDTLGSINSDTNGVFTWVVPTTITNGTSYRIRVVATNPVRASSDNGIDIRIGNTPVAKPIAGNNSPVCNNDTLKLSATSSTSGVTYSWTGPNSYTSSLQNPTISSPLPANGGNYIVTARLFGCQAKDTTAAIVFAGSGAIGVLATYNTPVCEADTLKISGTAGGTNLSYSWTGPNNFSSNDQTLSFPSATTSLSGDYVLYVSNGSCVARDTVNVTIKPLPANVSATSNSPVCTKENLSFSATSSSVGVTWSWTGPNGFNTTSATPVLTSVSPIHNGNYFLTADLNGCTVSDTLPVMVKLLPVKPIATNNSPFCAGGTLQLNSTGNSNNTYSWAGPNSYSSSVQNPAIPNSTVAISGDYIVTVDSNGCLSMDTTIVAIKPVPNVVTLSNNSPLCAGSTLQLNATASTTGATYAWTGPGSYIANTQNTGRTNTTVGMTGWYKMTVDLNGCTYEDSTYATVHPIPASPVLSYNNPLCTGETLNLTANSVSGASYNWTGANNFSSSQQNPNRSSMQFGDTGTYRATVTVNGCTSTADSVSVQLNPKPFVVVLANPGDTICNGDPAVFTALPNNHGGSPSYAWYVNNQLAGPGTVYTSSALNNGAVIRAEMTEYTKCSVPFTDSSNDITMKVLPWLAPSVSITSDPNRPLEKDEYVKFTATATNAGTLPEYQWKRNGTDVLGATGKTWSANTLSDNDNISVEVISTYRCPSPATAISNSVTVKVLTGVGDIEKEGGFKLYPNPAKGAPLYLSPKGRGLVMIQVLDITGRVVHVPVNELADKYSIEVSGLAAGSYMLKLSIDDDLKTFRFEVIR